MKNFLERLFCKHLFVEKFSAPEHREYGKLSGYRCMVCGRILHLVKENQDDPFFVRFLVADFIETKSLTVRDYRDKGL
jgi:hypothetical protein